MAIIIVFITSIYVPTTRAYIYNYIFYTTVQTYFIILLYHHPAVALDIINIIFIEEEMSTQQHSIQNESVTKIYHKTNDR